MNRQGYNSDGELMSSAFVEKEDNNPAFVLDCSNLPSLTRQEFAEECDINFLMAKYETTGMLPSNMNTSEPRYLDVSDVPDLRTAMDQLNSATTAFMALPATVRREFDNDPVKFVDFAGKSENIEKLREWKLAPPKPEPVAPTKVEVINPVQAPPGQAPDLSKGSPARSDAS